MLHRIDRLISILFLCFMLTACDSLADETILSRAWIMDYYQLSEHDVEGYDIELMISMVF